MKPLIGKKITEGFPPIVGSNPKLLILGSLPSVQSVGKRQYYAHSRNSFWPIMGELFGAGTDKPYEERQAIIADAGIAIWDVLAASVRPGSMDADIDQNTAKPNDIHAFLRQHPGIKLICFNGHTAATLYRKFLIQAIKNNLGDFEYAVLPSTSPAYASMRFPEKLRQWSTAIDAQKRKG